MQTESAYCRFERLLLTVWVGSLLAIGYIAAPMLFKLLDRQLAGQVAGEMFAIVSMLGLACGGLLLLGAFTAQGRKSLQQWRVWVLLAMVISVAVGFFALQPAMAALKLEGLVEGSDTARRFGMLHGISSLLWLSNSLLGVLLVVAGLHGEKRCKRDDHKYL